MVKTLDVNAINDLYLEADGNITILSDLTAVLFACASAAKAQLGEMIYAQGSGMPNFQTVWVGVPDIQIYKSYLTNVLLSVSGVIEIDDLIVKISDNVLYYTATIKTIYGIGTLNG